MRTLTLGHHDYCWAVGSVAGYRHLNRGLGSQDAVEVRAREHLWVAVVADGCGSGADSGVGARLGAQLLAERAVAVSRRGRVDLDVVVQQVVAELGERWLPPLGDVLTRQFLFTTLFAVADCERVSVWARGDGVVNLNGEQVELGPFAGNRPPYLCDSLLGLEVRPTATFERTLPLRELDSLTLATDGALDLGARQLEEWVSQTSLQNPDGLRRALFRRSHPRPRIDARTGLITHPGRVLADDTTVCVLKRREAS